MKRLSVIGLCLGAAIFGNACGEDGNGGSPSGGGAGQGGNGGSAGSSGGSKATSGGTGGKSMTSGGAAGEPGTSSGGEGGDGQSGAGSGNGGSSQGGDGGTSGSGGSSTGTAGDGGSGQGGTSGSGGSSAGTAGDGGSGQGGTVGTGGSSAGTAGEGGSGQGGSAGTGGTGCSVEDRSCSQSTLLYCPAGAELTLECLTGCSTGGTSPACNQIPTEWVTVAGGANFGQIVLYGFSAEAGQTAIFEVQPSSQFDTRILLCRADGTACNTASAIADSNTQTDGVYGELDRVSHTFEAAGDYIVGVRSWFDDDGGIYDLYAQSLPPPLPVVFGESFDVWPPVGWDIALDSGSFGWEGCDPNGSCYRDVPNPFSAATGPFAAADSDHFGMEPMDTSLTSPVIDLTGYTNAELVFASSYLAYDTDFGEVQISADGAAFTTLLTIDTTTSAGFVRLDLSAYTGSEVQLRFHYVGDFDYFWLIDEIRVGAE